MLHSGVHATLAGVLLAVTIPSGQTLDTMRKHLLNPVSWVVLPLFAIANTALPINTHIETLLQTPLTLGILAGLILGKPIGILSFSYIAIKAKLCKFPTNINWYHILGLGCLGGIGFTMSLFITFLALENPSDIINAKVAILAASVISAILGICILFAVQSKSESANKT